VIRTLTEPFDLVAALSEGHGLCFLDGAPGRSPSRVLADPEAVFVSKDGRGTLRWRDGREEPADGDPFRLLDALLRTQPHLLAGGYWGYDLRYHLERLPRLALDDLALPDCWIGLYEGGVRSDLTPQPPSLAGKGELVGTEVVSGLQRLPSPFRGGAGGGVLDIPSPTHASIKRKDYENTVRRVLEYIAAGDCYQVNLSHRLTTPLPCSPWTLYGRLREASPAPYAAYLDCGDHQVLSSSPELFLRVRGGEVETRPIKGTRPRGASPEEDRALAAELLSSVKDRAELLMIVDLERNDLGRVCEYGSVHVPELFRLETYSNVHHLVATVRGRLRCEVTPLECLRAAFPGGSITGAPKIRAMEIIEELEPVRRGVYTGAIGWVDGHGNAEWNIAIRTMLVKDGQVHFHVGGGIVADSDPAAEYEETMAKAQGMLRALAAE
jgi:para-aminobenzoate synthetase component 1